MSASTIAIATISTPQPARAEQLTLENLVQQAASKDPATAQEAIAKLRDFKNVGVDAFWKTYQSELPNNPQLRASLDAICQQKDCDASRLYWYKDLETAKAASKETGKPILSLRLLGNLNDELSCANSRFFRTALYPNAAVSQLLRDRFILHWQSERPVPKVTIDFGDGRKLEQTLTGNSIHYILDSEGRPIDAVPGLYSPQVFITNLKSAESVFQSLRGTNGDLDLRREILTKYHRDRYAKLAENWQADLTRLRLPLQPLLPLTVTDPKASAMLASRLTIGKAMVELPTLSRTNGEPLAEFTTTSQFSKLSDENWARLARLYQNRVYLDRGSLNIMQRKLSPTASMPTVVSSFERAIAQDTVRNEYVFHAQIHNWFANGEFMDSDPAVFVALNRRVYDQLFLTPASDPWLGLVNENVYSGISKVN
ncbi:thioredoxin family protein [Pseudanabaena sp. UWO310]|uniref:thioredoxin family protein n=1 Tax=Pseudanabaena sp. UWO310 TaxID=2480795 RepID=UPI001CC1FA44|nr:thioredoxin family protein [Pseudanabaena sp. UWO310]